MLVQQIAGQPQHVFVGMVGRQVLVAQMQPVKRQGFHLVVAHGEQRESPLIRKRSMRTGVHQWDQRGVTNDTQLAPLKVVDLEAEQFG